MKDTSFSVQLVAQTSAIPQPGAHDGMSPNEFIAYVARVSNPTNQMNHDTAPKLLKYLIKHKHWSPFEHAYLTFKITTSRAIAAQILRHRSFVFQEFSQRYQVATNTIAYKARRQDSKNRQNSIDDMSDEDQAWFAEAQKQLAEKSMEIYNTALQKGVAKEQARMVLPLSTETTLFMTGSVRSWLHYIEVRTDPTTQKEHRDIALAIKSVVSEHYPELGSALWQNF